MKTLELKHHQNKQLKLNNFFSTHTQCHDSFLVLININT